MPQTEEEYRKTYESEKARTVILLGFLSMILTVRVLLHDGDYWNFPWWCSCPHFTVWLMPTFTNWIYLWLGYIVCMLIYVSEDRFDKYGVERSRAVRELVRRIGIRVFVLWYPLTILFFSTFGGVSFQLPESVQTPYWLMVTFLFVFYVIWTAEGLFGKKIVGQSSILNEPIDGFIDLAREGMETIARVLVYVWRRVMRAIGHPQTEPIEAKLVMRVFFSVVALVVITLAYFVEHLTGYDLLYAFGIPLYVILFASVFIGWLVKRKRRGKLVPLPQVS